LHRLKPRKLVSAKVLTRVEAKQHDSGEVTLAIVPAFQWKALWDSFKENKLMKYFALLAAAISVGVIAAKAVRAYSA
jgi:hypothetical protein